MNRMLLVGVLAVLLPMGLGADDGETVRILKDVQTGHRHLEEGKFEAAQKSFEKALRLTESQAAGPVVLRDRLHRMIDRARQHKERHDRYIDSMRRQQARQLARNDLEERRRFHRAKVDHLTRQVERHVEGKRYEQAERLSRDVLSLDPDNAKLKHFLQFSSHEAERTRERAVKNAKEREAKKMASRMDEDYIVQSELMTFPGDFDKKTRQREKVRTPPEPEWKTDLKNRMGQKVSFNLVNMPFDDVLKHLESVYELPIIVESRVREDVFDDGKGPVDLRSKGMTIEAALRWIVEPVGIHVAYKNGAIYLTENRSLTEDRHTLVYDVRDLAHVPPDFEAPDISLAGGEEGSTICWVAPSTNEYNEGTDPEELVELIEAIIEAYEAQFK